MTFLIEQGLWLYITDLNDLVGHQVKTFTVLKAEKINNGNKYIEINLTGKKIIKLSKIIEFASSENQFPSLRLEQADSKSDAWYRC